MRSIPNRPRRRTHLYCPPRQCFFPPQMVATSSLPRQNYWDKKNFQQYPVQCNSTCHHKASHTPCKYKFQRNPPSSLQPMYCSYVYITLIYILTFICSSISWYLGNILEDRMDSRRTSTDSFVAADTPPANVCATPPAKFATGVSTSSLASLANMSQTHSVGKGVSKGMRDTSLLNMDRPRSG